MALSALPALASARRAAGSTQLNFTHWTVHASGGGASVRQKVPPGGTFRICSSAKLTELDAHYRSSLPSGTSVHTVWKVTGQTANSEPGKAFPSGYFYVANPHGLPLGTWTIKVVRHGTKLGATSIDVVKEHC